MYFSQARGFKLAILGAMSSVGQVLALLLKQSCEFDEIAVFDDRQTAGLALELNNTATFGSVTSHVGCHGLGPALKDANIVLLAGGVPYDGEAVSMPKKEFDFNCKSVYEYARGCIKYNTNAIVCVVTAPVNCTMPIVSQTFINVSKYLQQKIVGVNTLQTVRAYNCVYDFFELKPKSIQVPVVGGCSPRTAVPIFSYVSPSHVLPYERLNEMMKAFQKVTAHAGGHHICSLSHSYGASLFVNSLVKAIKGSKDVVENAFILNKKDTEFPYFSMPVNLGCNGVESEIGIPPSATSFEKTLIENAKNLLKKDVSLGLEYHKRFVSEAENREYAKV